MGYTKDTIKGVSWVGLLRGVTRVISLLRTLVLARLLLPVQFGVYGVATLLLALLEILTDTGINVILIQESNIDEYVNTAWVVSILRGMVISLLIIILTPFVANFFNSPLSRNILYLIALVPLIRGIINPSIVKLQKELQFRKDFYFRSFLFFIDAVVSISFAIITKSAVSLVFGQIISAIFEVILTFVLVKPSPKLIIEKDKFIKVINSGKWVTLAGIFEYLYRNLDNIVVGRLLGTTMLGFYDMAYKISSLPITEVSDVFSKVVFPVYSKIKDDKVRLKRAFLKVVFTITIVAVPAMFILFLFTKSIVQVVLGPNWLPIVNVLKILVILGVIRAISGSSSALFLAVKKQNYVTTTTSLSIFGLAVTIVPLTKKLGIKGAAISAIIGSVFALPAIIVNLKKVFLESKD